MRLKKIRWTVITTIFGLHAAVNVLVISPARAALEFKCEHQHGGPSIIRLIGNQTLEYKILPMGDWKAAETHDFGQGWITFEDGWGPWSEETKIDYLRAPDGRIIGPGQRCEKYENVCGAYIKFFEYGQRKNFGYKLTNFTSQNCCLAGEDLEKGSEVGFEHCDKY